MEIIAPTPCAIRACNDYIKHRDAPQIDEINRGYAWKQCSTRRYSLGNKKYTQEYINRSGAGNRRTTFIKNHADALDMVDQCRIVDLAKQREVDLVWQ